MAPDQGKLTNAEVAYCWATILMAIGVFLIPLVGYSSLWMDITQFLALGLALLLPIGLVVGYSRPRWTVPRPVVLCIFATGLWVCALIKYNWH